MGIVVNILIGAVGFWYLVFPKSVVTVNGWLGSKKPQPSMITYRVMGCTMLLFLLVIWFINAKTR